MRPPGGAPAKGRPDSATYGTPTWSKVRLVGNENPSATSSSTDASSPGLYNFPCAMSRIKSSNRQSGGGGGQGHLLKYFHHGSINNGGSKRTQGGNLESM